MAGLELVEVPTADGQTALVLVHAAAEVGNIGLAGSGGLVVGRSVSAVVGRIGKRLGLLLGRS